MQKLWILILIMLCTIIIHTIFPRMKVQCSNWSRRVSKTRTSCISVSVLQPSRTNQSRYDLGNWVTQTLFLMQHYLWIREKPCLSGECRGLWKLVSSIRRHGKCDTIIYLPIISSWTCDDNGPSLRRGLLRRHRHGPGAPLSQGSG